jgi:hypothetical protein
MSMPADISMECRLIDAELDRGFGAGAPEERPLNLSQQALEHLRNCGRCRRLYQWLVEGLSPAEASPAVCAKIQSQLKESLRPVTPQPAPGVLAAQFLLVFLLFASPAVGMLGASGLREMGLAQLIGIGAVLILGAALLSLSLAWQMTPGSLHRVPAKAAILTLAAGFLLGITILFPWHTPEAFLTRGWSCLKAGLLMAIPAAVLFWLLVRRGHALATGALGGTLGAIAGLLGTTVLQLTCDRQDAGHLLVWHGGVLVVSIGVGILVAWAIRVIGTRA